MTSTRTIAIIAGQLVVGGAERQLYLWLRKLDRHRFQPVVVTLHPDCGDFWESSITELDIPVFGVRRQRHPLLRLWQIVRVLRPYRPALVHGWHLFASPYAGAAARFLGAKASLGGLRSSFPSLLRNRREGCMTRLLVDSMLVNSRSSAEQLARTPGWKDHRIYIVPNAVENHVQERDQAREEFRRQWGIPESRIWIGSVGRMDADKGFDVLLDICRRCYARGEEIHLLLAGDGPLKSALEAKARTLGLSGRVSFLGEQPEIRTWLSALDIFCFTSTDEGLPNAVMEAAMAGVAVCAWRLPCVEELLQHRKSALLVPIGEVPALTRAVVELVQRRELRIALGAAAKRRMSRDFSIGQYVRRLTAVYEYLLSAGQPDEAHLELSIEELLPHSAIGETTAS